MPYSISWPISEEFCSFIHHNQALFEGKSVVELGAGAGLPGLYAAAYAKNVCLTDSDDQVLQIAKCNISLNNATNVVAEKLRWGDELSLAAFQEAHVTPFDIVLGSDILYPLTHCFADVVVIQNHIPWTYYRQ